MLIFAQTPALTPEWRDQLALWSDILGVFGFVISVVGLLVGLWINRQVKEAREEARRMLARVAIARQQADVAILSRAMTLAREASRATEWVRTQAHLDAAAEWAVRIVNAEVLPTETLEKLETALESIRDLKRIASDRRGTSRLSKDRQQLFDSIIEAVTAVESAIQLSARDVP